MASRRKYQSIQGLAESAELIVPEDPTEDQSAMGKEIASEPKPASIPEPISKPERENQNDYESIFHQKFFYIRLFFHIVLCLHSYRCCHKLFLRRSIRKLRCNLSIM